MASFLYSNRKQSHWIKIFHKDVLIVRITKYKTILTNEGKAVLEKELSVNCPAVDKTMNAPHKLEKLATHFLKMHEQTEEHLYMVCLNTKLHMTSVFEVSHGNVNSSIFSVREILQKALLANAVNIVMMHNHPSGDPTPSRQDVTMTEKLKEAGEIVGIGVLDHLIIGRGRYISLKDRGDI